MDMGQIMTWAAEIGRGKKETETRATKSKRTELTLDVKKDEGKTQEKKKKMQRFD